MTHRAIKFWWRVIPVNLVVIAVNLLFIVTIPFGLWRGLTPDQFLTFLLAVDAVAWLAAFAWFFFNPIDLGLD